jgi:hypothetical protein
MTQSRCEEGARQISVGIGRYAILEHFLGGLIVAGHEIRCAKDRGAAQARQAPQIKWISGEAIAVLNRADRLEPVLRSIALRDRNGAVERDNRGTTDRGQRIV